MSDVIEIRDLSFAYRRPRVQVFSGLSLSIAPRDATCILGHNGAGKTTLLKLTYGSLLPCAGTVRIDRRVVGSYWDILFLSGKFGIDQQLSLRQNLIFRCGLAGRRPASVLSSPLIEQFHLGRFLDTPASKLSAGYFMRANIVAGLVFHPSLLLLDEPTNSIDPASRELLLQTLRAQRDRGVTIVLITHDLDSAYALADRLIVLDDGEIVEDARDPRDADVEDVRQAYIRYTEGAE